MTQLLQPAIQLAEHGFPASPLLVASLRGLDGPGRLNLQELAGQAVHSGDRVQRPGAARVLRAIAAAGREGFYGGEFGEGLLELGAGWFRPADLERVQADWVTPLSVAAWGRPAVEHATQLPGLPRTRCRGGGRGARPARRPR